MVNLPLGQLTLINRNFGKYGADRARELNCRTYKNLVKIREINRVSSKVSEPHIAYIGVKSAKVSASASRPLGLERPIPLSPVVVALLFSPFLSKHGLKFTKPTFVSSTSHICLRDHVSDKAMTCRGRVRPYHMSQVECVQIIISPFQVGCVQIIISVLFQVGRNRRLPDT